MCSMIYFLFILSFATFGRSVVVHSVYYEMPPFIYRDKEGVLQGMFPEIAQAALELCDIDMKFTLDTKTAKNFTAILNDSLRNQKYIDESWLWFPLVEQVSKRTLNKFGLYSLQLFFSPGIEVVVHRDQIGILPKIVNGVTNSRYLITMALILAIVFGILIWGLVSIS